MSIDQFERAQKVGKVLVDRARMRSIITYKELGAEVGIHHRAIQYALAPIQEYCLVSNFPPLTILVVNKTGRPGSGFVAAKENEFESRESDVFSYQ